MAQDDSQQPEDATPQPAPDADAVALYGRVLTLPGGTSATMWPPSLADLKAMQNLTSDMAGFGDLIARMELAIVEVHPPRAGQPLASQPVPWLNELLHEWMGTAKDGGLPPPSAAS